MWSIPYARITAASSEKADTPRVTLRTVTGARVLECRQLTGGEKAQDYQGKLRHALVTILDRRTHRAKVKTQNIMCFPERPALRSVVLRATSPVSDEAGARRERGRGLAARIGARPRVPPGHRHAGSDIT